MSAYIYTLVETVASGKVQQLNASTRKYVITDYVNRSYLDKGLSIASLTIIRSKDGYPGSAVHVDPYEFMKIDLGEP